jgi:hypothetical protein
VLGHDQRDEQTEKRIDHLMAGVVAMNDDERIEADQPGGHPSRVLPRLLGAD